jgi:hypothetical protein
MTGWQDTLTTVELTTKTTKGKNSLITKQDLAGMVL